MHDPFIDTDITTGVYPHADLDWAFAGRSSSWTTSSTLHARWSHIIDSRHLDARAVIDEGIIVHQPDGTSLETGRMPRSADIHSPIVGYEESWVDLPLKGDAQGRVYSVVLQLGSGAERDGRAYADQGGGSSSSADASGPIPRGIIVRVGDRCQGIMRTSATELDAITVEGWCRKEEDEWVREVRVGDGFLPCGVAFEPRRVEVGSEIKYGEMRWKVTEMSCFSASSSPSGMQTADGDDQEED